MFGTHKLFYKHINPQMRGHFNISVKKNNWGYIGNYITMIIYFIIMSMHSLRIQNTEYLSYKLYNMDKKSIAVSVVIYFKCFLRDVYLTYILDKWEPNRKIAGHKTLSAVSYRVCRFFSHIYNPIAQLLYKLNNWYDCPMLMCSI